MHSNTARIMRAMAIGCALFAATTTFAQVPADREILLSGEGAGQGQPAESNGYPGPKHILDMQKELQLSDDQRKSVQAIYDEMKSRAKELGKTIVKIEEELDAAFKDGMVTEKSVRSDSEEIGRIRGKLRSVHLIAHMKAQKVLNDAQIAKYKKMRTKK